MPAAVLLMSHASEPLRLFDRSVEGSTDQRGRMAVRSVGNLQDEREQPSCWRRRRCELGSHPLELVGLILSSVAVGKFCATVHVRNGSSITNGEKLAA